MTQAPTPARSYKEFIARRTARARLREVMRDSAVALLSLSRSIAKGGGWIGFPYYHHVFDDERAGFARQLQYLRNFGEFISLDDALKLINSSATIDGRFFCLTFDDGFRNVHRNATPIARDHGAPLAIFVATSFIGNSGDSNATRSDFFEYGGATMEFLTWDEVRALRDGGCTIGSHTVSHLRLKTAPASDVAAELAESRKRIEAETGGPCKHFCVPFGVPNIDFDPSIHPGLAADAGYRSFLTTQRGINRSGNSYQPAIIRRDHMLASWSPAQLRYFFGV